MYDGFAIGAGAEHMPARHKLFAQLYIVEYFAITYYPDGAVFVGYRLQAAFQVNYAQAVVPERCRSIYVSARHLGPAVVDCSKHGVQQIRLNRLCSILVYYPCYSTHTFSPWGDSPV